MKFTAAATGGGTLVWSVNGIAGGDTTVGTVGIPPLTSSLQITTPSGLPPQPGIQLFDTIPFGPTPYNPKLAQAFATDLQGNVHADRSGYGGQRQAGRRKTGQAAIRTDQRHPHRFQQGGEPGR